MSSKQGAILFLTSWYPVEYNSTHGIFIRNHAIALSKFRKVIVLYAYCSREKPYYQMHKIQVNENLTEYYIRYTKPAFTLRPFSSALQLLKLNKAHRLLIKRLQKTNLTIDAIQVNVIFPVALVLKMYKKLFRVEHTIIEHWSGYLPQDGNYKGSTLKQITEACVLNAKRVWHISESQKEAMISHGLIGNYELIYNAVDTKVFVPTQTPKSRIKLLHVSSLVEREKNISGTLLVIKELQEKDFDFDFVVVGGDGEDLHEAKEIAKQLKIKNIEFTGILSSEKIALQMQSASALILFSHYEGMPVVALEALSCGLPVMAGKVGQLPNIISNEFGVLVDVNNKTQMVQALENLFLNKYKFNPHAMREFVLQHASYEAVGKQMSDFYK